MPFFTASIACDVGMFIDVSNGIGRRACAIALGLFAGFFPLCGCEPHFLGQAE